MAARLVLVEVGRSKVPVWDVVKDLARGARLAMVIMREGGRFAQTTLLA